MTNRHEKKQEVLMVTFGLAGGSFMAFKNIAEKPSKRFRFTILGLGSYTEKPDGYTINSIPYVRYDGLWGHLASKYTVFGFILQMPLYLVATGYMILKRPKIVIFNGLATMLPLLPLAKLLGLKVVLSFRSWWDHDRFKTIEPIVRFYCSGVDFCFVNSTGTKENIHQIISEKKVTVVSHHAKPVFFENKDRKIIRKSYNLTDGLAVLYVGRLDEEKHCDFMIDLIEKVQDPDIHFFFVGDGKLRAQIADLEKKRSNVHYLGFISDPKKLSRVYAASDVLWSNADETYFARPAVEALASGTPLMIFRVPAIGEKILKNVEIPASMVPSEIGWIIDHRDMDGTIRLIQSFKKSDVLEDKRITAAAHAKKYYSRDPNLALINNFEKLL